MCYRTILVHVDDSAHSAARIEVAADIARRCGAHLVGAALTGISRFLYQSWPSEDKDPDLALHLGFLRERAAGALANFTRQAEASALASHESRLIDDEAGAGLSLHARAADLVVLGQGEPGAPAEAPPADLAPEVLIDCARPVLIVPNGRGLTPEERTLSGIGSDVLVAWDASREAARALLLALPLLQQAASVRIAVFDTGASQRTVADAMAADPRPMLARHGVHAELSLHAVGAGGVLGRARLGDDVGQALLSLAADIPADLLVMGAYGHSRLRETLLGGVTRTVLETMTIPVLMAH